jgi:PAS domain S-box-containing protein
VEPQVGRGRETVARGATTADVERTPRNVTGVEQTEAEKALRESEARFRELADNISQFAWTADRSGWIYWYNKRWHDYTGTTLKEMEGWGWQKVHHPDHVERVVQRIRQSFETGTPWEDTFPLRRRDGNYRWFLSRALPIRNEIGEVIRWFGTNTDITEQIEAEKALRELNETLEQRVEAETRERLQIWNVSQDLLVVADLDGTYLSVNPAWTTILGWSALDLIGRTSQWLLHADDQETTRAEISRLAAGKNTSRFENRFRHKEGSFRWISWKAAPDQGRIYAMGRDVTDLKDAEKTLQEIREELSQVAQRTMLAAMSAAIAHEIKQPLAAIVTNANAGLRWLNRTPPELNEARATFERIAGDGRRANEVVQSVRGMIAKTDQGLTSLDISELIRDTIVLVRRDLEAAGILVQLKLAPRLPSISGHQGRLQQVILNIVTNAADAMRAVADRERVLTVTCASEAESVVVSVQDSGTGIDKNNAERIFEPFFTTKRNGMGIGLAVCRTIIQAHGGQLSASPALPHGSVFRIVLPAAAGT